MSSLRSLAAVSTPAFAGHLHVTAARRDDGQTVIAAQSFRAPFHLGKPYWDGRVLQAQIVNTTAGILAGDALELDVRVGEGAALLVTTPAATRAYVMRSGAAGCRQFFQVGRGGWLEYAPEPLFPHRDTSYTQTTRLEVADGGEVFFADALAPGRVGRGESWAWKHLRLALDVRLAGVPVLCERLDAAGETMARLAQSHGTPRGWFGNVVVLSPRLEADDPILWARVRALHAGAGGRWVGASRLRRGGWIVRVIAPDGQAWRDTLAEIREVLAERLPALRSDLRKL